MEIILDNHGLQKGQAVRFIDPSLTKNSLLEKGKEHNGVISSIGATEFVIKTADESVNYLIDVLPVIDLEIYRSEGVTPLPIEENIINPELDGCAIRIDDDNFLVSDVSNLSFTLLSRNKMVSTYHIGTIKELIETERIKVL